MYRIQWMKLIWEVVLLAVVFIPLGAYYLTPAPAVVQPKPVPAVVIAAPQPVSPAPAAPIRPRRVPAPKPKKSCAWVPSIAYNHPWSEVEQFARMRGLSGAQIAELHRCVGG